VATVAVDGTKNAGFLAARILSIKYPQIRDRLAEAREKARAAYGSGGRLAGLLRQGRCA
jgi:phosphoribosylcarboxyaminoimidazole (NCAIR) mutase